jgi:hypothetical protein
MTHFKESPVYTAAFFSTGITVNPLDVIGILASSLSRVAIHKVEIGLQSSAAPVGEDVGVLFLRGSTASSTGAAITPKNVDGFAHKASAGSSVTSPSSILVSTASAELVYATNWHAQDDTFVYEPREWQDRLRLEASQRLHVRITGLQLQSSPAIYATLTFSEIGNVPTYTVSPTAKS